MKKRLVFLFSVVCLTLLSSIASANQLLNNPNFENGVSSFWVADGPNWVAQNTIVDEGTLSAKNTVGTLPNLDYFVKLYQEVPATANTAYYATVRSKTNHQIPSSTQAGILLEFLNSSGTVISASSVQSSQGGVNDWKLLYASQTSPVGTAKIRYSCFVFAPQGETQTGGAALGGESYFDQAVLSTDFIAPPPPTTDLTNPGFENFFTGWAVNGAGWSTQNTVLFEGALSSVNQIPAAPAFAAVSQKVAANPNTIYYATVQAKTDISPQSFAVAGLSIQFYNGNTVLGAPIQKEIGGLTDWTQLYVSGQSPANADFVQYNLFVFAGAGDTKAIGGKAYFDKAVLTKTFIPGPAPQTTLLNAGLENGINSWKIVFPDSAVVPAVIVDNTVVKQGQYSLKNIISATPQPGGYFAAAYQDLTYLGGPVWASAQVKTAIPVNSLAIGALKLEYYDAAGSQLSASQQQIGATNDWTRLLINGVTPPAGTTRIRVMILTFATQADASKGGIAYFDDVNFSYTALPPNANNINLENAGFENGLSNWSDLFGFPATVSSPGHTGTLAAKKTIGVAVAGTDYYSQIYQDVYATTTGTVFPTDTPVYATAFVKTDINPLVQSLGGLAIEFINSAGQVIKDINNNPIIIVDFISAKTDWRKLYVTGKTPAGTQRVRVSGLQFANKDQAAQGGDTYYDDFVFSLTPIAPPSAQIQLLNPDFENGLAEWDQTGKPAQVSNVIVFGGQYAANFMVDDVASQNYFGAISQDVVIDKPLPPPPGQLQAYYQYVVNTEVMIKTDLLPTSSASARLEMRFFDKDGNFIIGQATAPIGGITNWTKVSINNYKAPDNAKTVRISLSLFAPQGVFGNVGKQAWFDNAKLTIVRKKGPLKP